MKSKIMVVDDEMHIRELVRFYLDKAGFDTIEAANAEEALDIVENQYIDLAVVDIMMPGMDGFGFLEEFDKLPEQVKNHSKVVMLSTSESFKDLNKANQSRYVYKFLNKPLNKAILDAINV